MASRMEFGCAGSGNFQINLSDDDLRDKTTFWDEPGKLSDRIPCTK